MDIIVLVLTCSDESVFTACSCSLPGGEGFSGQGPRVPEWRCHSQVSGVRQSSTLFLLVQRGWTIHLRQCRETQTGYVTRFLQSYFSFVSHYIQGSDLITSVHRLHIVSTCKPVSDHLLLICVCRGRVVLPQCPAKRRRHLRLYLPRSAQHQQEPS